MAKTHKAQHFIPKSYLSGWCDPTAPSGHTPYVHVFSKDGLTSRKKAPGNIFTLNDFYTITESDGSRNLRLEHGLEHFERAFFNSRREFLEQHRDLPAARRAKLLDFMATLHARTPAMIEHHGAFWKEIEDAGLKIERQMKSATPEERKRAVSALSSPGKKGRGMSLDEVSRIANSPVEHLLPALISAEAPLLRKMAVIVLCAKSPIGFITSDKPVVWFCPSAHKKPPLWRSPSFSDPDLEITLPLSPHQMLLLMHGDNNAPIQYVDVPDNVVSELNRRTRFHCDQHFVGRTTATESYWFDPGAMPDDAWEKQNPIGEPSPA